MTDSIKTRSFRLTEETTEKFKKICAEFDNQNEALNSLISAFELTQAKAILTDRATEITDFEAHLTAVQKAFTYSLELNSHAESRIRQEFSVRLDTQTQTIADLQDRLRQSEEQVRNISAKSDETIRKAETDKTTAEQNAKNLDKELQQVRKELEQEKKLSAVTIEAKDRLQADINQFKEKASQLDSKQKELDTALQKINKLTDEINKLKAEIEQIQKTKEQEINTALLIQQAELTQTFNQKISQLQEQHTQQIASLLSGINQNFKSDNSGSDIDK